jgi:outer membrane immunogenic protein
MKKFALALLAVATVATPALAADMAARPMKAPPMAAPAPVASWTGCYIGVGGGYGIYRVDHDERISATNAPFVQNVTAGGDGWLVQGQVGCDYQFAQRWVIGAFGDYEWSRIRGDTTTFFGNLVGSQEQNWSWGAGARVGYLAFPQLLTYVDAGYTQANFNGTSFSNQFTPFGPTGVVYPSQTFSGFFVGSGFEYALDFFPGLFLKSEGRANWYSRKDVVPVCTSAPAGGFCAVGQIGLANPFGFTDSRRPIVYTAVTSLVYRFNFGR